MKRILVSIILAVSVLPVFAKDADMAPTVRLGWGDMTFEAMCWHTNSTTCNYRNIGHFFGEFQYPLLDWLGVGFKADWSMTLWDVRNDWKSPVRESNRNFSNICMIPDVRFTYYRKGRIEMYSGLGIGLNINTGTEVDWKDRKTAFAPVIDLTAYGISLGCRHWFSSLELGGLNSFVNFKREIYMLGSRIVSVSIGYRF